MKIKRSISIYLGVLSIALVMLSSDLFSQQVLKPQEAFQIEIFMQNDVIQINHRIEDGYYLYKDKISYTSIQENIVLSDYTLPDGIQYEDEFFGKTEIYRAPFTVYITLKESSKSLPLKLEVNSQGCADIGLCYPPQSWIMDVQTGSNLEAAFLTNETSVSEEVRLGSMITESNLINVFFAFIGLGFLLAFTPCHLPTIPILSSIIIGQKDSNPLDVYTLRSLSKNEAILVEVASSREFSPSDARLQDRLCVLRPRMSQMCNRLYRAGILSVQQKGRSRMYKLTNDARAQLVAWGMMEASI